MKKLKIHTLKKKLLNKFKVLRNFTIILSHVTVTMNIQKCKCLPDSPSYLNENDMIICNFCGGWIEGQY